MPTVADRIKEAMELRGLKQADLIERSGINKGALSSYLSGRYKPKQTNTFLLAKALDVNEAWLMGADVPMERIDYTFPNIRPIATQRLPVLSAVACGEPILRHEEKEVYVDVTIAIKADFILIAKGDSMIGARIHDGDLVFIRSQPEVENGEIAAVAIDDDATLKRFYKYRDLIVLRAENPSFPEMQFRPEDGHTIRVLGKAVAFQSDVK